MGDFNFFSAFDFGGPSQFEEEEETPPPEEDFFSPHPTHMQQNKQENFIGGYNETPRVDTPAYQAQGYEGATGEVAPVDSVGTDPHSTLSRFAAWAQRKPKREDYKVGTMDKIAAGLSSFASGFTGSPIGDRAAHQLLHGRFDDAMNDWMDEGKALKEVGTLGQKFAQTDAVAGGNIMDYNAKLMKNKTDMEKNLADIQDSKRRHEAAMKKIEVEGGNTQNKNAEILRHNKELEGLLKQQNSIKSEANAIDRIQANAYAAGVAAKGKGGDQKVTGDMYNTQQKATADAVKAMLADPQFADMRKIFTVDPATGVVTPNMDEINEGNYEIYKTFVQMAKNRADAALRAVGPLHGASDIDLPPVRQGIR